MISVEHSVAESDELRTVPRRARWRQRLVDAESGLRVGLRADSTLIVFFFCAGTVLMTALVLGLSRQEWLLLILSLGMAFAAELLHQVLKQLREFCSERFPELEPTLRLGSTGVMCAHLTVAVVTLMIFWDRFARLV